VAWELKNEGETSRLKLCWQESGGPPVELPEHKGFGSALIERAFNDEVGFAQFDFHSQGLTRVLEVAI
jgi:two-component system, chemotaxis family, CheB/CheR fusion protein